MTLTPSTRALRATAVALAAAALAVPFAARAQKLTPLPEGTMVISPMVGFAATGGGETLATVVYEDGHTKDIKSGGLAYFYGGAEARFVGSPFALQATVGYHYDTTAASNGDVTFSRVPFQFLGVLEPVERFRFGAGLHVDTNVRLGSSGVADDPLLHVKFKNAVGFVGKFEWMAMRELGIELSYVNVSYKPTEQGGVPVTGESVDGSHFGLGLNYHW